MSASLALALLRFSITAMMDFNCAYELDVVNEVMRHYALEDIPAGSELTLDYGCGDWGERRLLNYANYRSFPINLYLNTGYVAPISFLNRTI